MKKQTLCLAIAMALPGLASAAPPVAFGTDGSADDGLWNLDAGTQQIVHECPTGFTCGSAPVADNNFLQVQMTDDGTGDTFFRTIIATDTGPEAFTSESFVRSGSTNGGISANQNISSDQAGVGVLNSNTTLNTQSFNDGTEDQVVLSQGVWDTATSPEFHSGFGFTKNSAGDETTTTLSQEIVVANEFSDSFTFSQVKNPNTNAVTDTQLDIVSGVVLNDGGTVNDQTFHYSLRDGASVAAGDATIGADTVSWLAGEQVERVLVGQTVTDAGDFGYERVGNLTTATEITTFSLASVGPFSTITNNPFGTPADPSVITVPAP